MADNKPFHEAKDAVDPVTAQLRRLELERPDALLRRRVLADVDAVLKGPESTRPGFRPMTAWAALAGSLCLLLWGLWNPPESRPEISTAYVEATAHWLDLSPELAFHAVRPMSTNVASTHAPTLEGRLRHANHPAIDL